MAALAARTLLRLVDGEEADLPGMELTTRLVVRVSTAPVPTEVTGGDGAGPVRHRPPDGIRRSDPMGEMCNITDLGEYWTNGRDV